VRRPAASTPPEGGLRGNGVDAAARCGPGARAMTRTARAPDDLVYATRLPFDPGSPRTASYVEEHWSPALLRVPANRQAKADAYSALNYRPRNAQRDLSLSGGASIVLRASHVGHHPSGLDGGRWKNEEGDPLGSPSLELVYG
jgi:hypothetical protein